MPVHSMEGGFMEPTKHATYYENVYYKTRDEDDFTGTCAFDLCEDSSEEESNNSTAKHKRKDAQHVSSYGLINKPTYKPRIDKTPQPSYKIVPNRNARHSIRLVSPESEEEEQHEHLDGPTTQLKPLQGAADLSAEAFAEEKAWHHQLSGPERFDNVRRQRAKNRLRLHKACQQARKTKERALRNVEAAAACVVDDLPMRDSHIQIEINSSEAPTDFVDLTREEGRRRKKQANKPWPPKNWKGEYMKLEARVAYVLIIDGE